MSKIEHQRRIALAKAGKRYQQGRMSRREFMRLAGLAGFGFTSPHLLSGCNRVFNKPTKQPSRPPIAEFYSREQEQFLTEIGRQFRGQKLRIIFEETPSCQAVWEMVQESFIPLTGIEIQCDLLPLDRVLARITQDTALEAGIHDIFYIDQSWIGDLIDDTHDLSEFRQKSDLAYPGYNFDDLLPTLLEHITSAGGKLGGIPFDIPLYVMIYRRDILDELRLEVPTTIDSYLNVVKAIHEEKSPQIAGTVGQWLPGSYALNCDVSAWLWAHGGSFFNSAGQPTVNDEAAIAALEFMLELSKYTVPQSRISDWYGQAKAFRYGKAGIYMSWAEYFPDFDDPNLSNVVGLAEAAPCPHPLALRTPDECGFGETPGISVQGGGGLLLSRYSQQADLAWVFLQWCTSPEISLLASLNAGSSGIRYSSYDHPLTKEKAKIVPKTTRHMDVVLESALHHMGTSPHLPNWTVLANGVFPQEVGKLITQQQTVKQTVNNMAQQAALIAQSALMI